MIWSSRAQVIAPRNASSQHPSWEEAGGELSPRFIFRVPGSPISITRVSRASPGNPIYPSVSVPLGQNMSDAEYNRHWIRSTTDLPLWTLLWPRQATTVLISGEVAQGAGVQALTAGGPLPSARSPSRPRWAERTGTLAQRRCRQSPAGAPRDNTMSHKDHPSSCRCNEHTQGSFPPASSPTDGRHLRRLECHLMS